MGVHGLWKILEPAHRPVKLEALAQKRLAVDASIWIYQFLKAVRDQEGNALQNSHIVGFFRRICKLLFHGVRPVFVFDGGAPVLKRQTIAGRKQRREGRQEDAARTAARLLALQVKRRAEEEAERRKTTRKADEDDDIPEDVVYVDELDHTAQQRQQNRKFKRTDQYHLPELEHDFTQFGAQNDARLLSAEELKEYAKEFEGQDGGDFNDYADIDFSSPFFQSLPDADRYRILSTARLRSRLRMGYSKEQLDQMFPDRMAFSRFQIERVARRNELSQRLMNLQGRDDKFNVTRVAGEKGKEYVLVRNDGLDGGWVMSFVGQKGDVEGARSKPIDLEQPEKKDDSQDSDDDEGDFEDVPIEGLNRLPKVRNTAAAVEALKGAEARELRKALYESRRKQAGVAPKQSAQQSSSRKRSADEALFLDTDELEVEELFGGDSLADDLQLEEDLRAVIAMSLGNQGFQTINNEDEDLQRAIALSMGGNEPMDKGKGRATDADTGDLEDRQDVNTANRDFQFAVSESLKSAGSQHGPQLKTGEGSGSSLPRPTPRTTKLAAPLDLSKGSFLISKKLSGNFKAKSTGIPVVKNPKGNDTITEDEPPIPLPPWFGKRAENMAAGVAKARKTTKRHRQEFERSIVLESPQKPRHEVVDVESSENGTGNEIQIVEPGLQTGNAHEISMDDVTERLKTMPPTPPTEGGTLSGKEATLNIDDPFEDPANSGKIEWDLSEGERPLERPILESTDQEPAALPKPNPAPEPPNSRQPTPIREVAQHMSDERPTPPPPEIEEPDDLDLSFELETTPPPEVILQEDLDEEEMVRQMATEAEEHVRFAAELSHQTRAQNIADYERELKELRAQQKKDRRDADDVSQVMIQECQQLLKLFGLPYITAPMEAEAQCAELVKLGLVDGIVTDDSDVFLFGGNRVYRYMFNDKQVVQCYLTQDFEKEFSLDQKRLIEAAHLLGSDYTEGIPSVGPVTAIELLADFASEGGLKAFKEWWTHVQQGIERPGESNTSFRKKFRKNVAKVFLPPSFPNPHVDEAYLHPEVDSDPSPFEWGVPDLQRLREFLMSTIGWSQERTDQVLVPVVKDMNRKQAEGSQANITRFFEGGTGAGAFAPRVRQGASSRMERAMLSLHEQAKKSVAGSEEATDADAEVEVGEKRRRPMSMREIAAIGEATEERNEDEDDEEQPKKKGRKAKVPAKSSRGRGRRKKA